jgi:hypothetical protein
VLKWLVRERPDVLAEQKMKMWTDTSLSQGGILSISH